MWDKHHSDPLIASGQCKINDYNHGEFSGMDCQYEKQCKALNWDLVPIRVQRCRGHDDDVVLVSSHGTGGNWTWTGLNGSGQWGGRPTPAPQAGGTGRRLEEQFTSPNVTDLDTHHRRQLGTLPDGIQWGNDGSEDRDQNDSSADRRKWAADPDPLIASGQCRVDEHASYMDCNTGEQCKELDWDLVPLHVQRCRGWDSMDIPQIDRPDKPTFRTAAWNGGFCVAKPYAEIIECPIIEDCYKMLWVDIPQHVAYCAEDGWRGSERSWIGRPTNKPDAGGTG